MPRPAKIIRPVKKNLSLPEDVVAKVELELYSPAMQEVPQGAWQELVTGLLKEWLIKRGVPGRAKYCKNS